MQRRKKQLLGLVGLVMVAAMTILACILPSPGASAADGQNTTVRVQVVGNGSRSVIEILSIDDQEVFVTRRIKLEFRYAKATLVKAFLKNLGAVTPTRAGMEADADEVEIPLGGSKCNVGTADEFTIPDDQTVAYEDSFTTCTTDVELPGDLVGAYGVKFSLRAAAYNGNVGSSHQDNVEFTYLPARFVGETTYDTNGNPVVKIEMGSAVKHYEIVIFDKDGKPVFGSIDGTEGKYAALEYDGWPENTTVEDEGKTKPETVTLPFSGKDLASGKYQIVLIAYDGNDSKTIIALDYATADYDASKDHGGSPSHPGGPNDPDDPDKPGDPNDPNNPDRPDVPDTGINLLNGLNISQRDYIITGLLAFGLVIGFAIFLIVRRNRR